MIWLAWDPKMKQKRHKGLAKRVSVSKTGKIKRRKAGGRHLMSKKSGKNRRRLHSTAVVEGKRAKKLRNAT